jgi:hypothetical protein
MKVIPQHQDVSVGVQDTQIARLANHRATEQNLGMETI